MVTEEEREVARSLRGKKTKKPKKKPLSQQAWPKALGLCLLLGLAVGAIVALTRPPTPEALYAEAERLMKSEDQEKHDRAREGPISKYIVRFGDRDDEKTRQVRQWAEDYDSARYEKLIDRHLRHQKEKKGLPVEAQNESQKEAFDAALAEADGDRDKAAKLWRQVFDREGATGIGAVAKRHLAMLVGVEDELQRYAELRKQVRNSREEPALVGPRRAAFFAYRQEQLGDRLGAKASYDQLYKEALTDPSLRFWQVLAAARSRELAESLKEKKQNDKARLEQVRQVVADAKEAANRPEASWLDLRLVGHEVALLYAGEEDLKQAVTEARALVKTLDDRLKGGSKPDG